MRVESLERIQWNALVAGGLRGVQRPEKQKLYQCILTWVNIWRRDEQAFDLRYYCNSAEVLDLKRLDPIGSMERKSKQEAFVVCCRP